MSETERKGKSKPYRLKMAEIISNRNMSEARFNRSEKGKKIRQRKSNVATSSSHLLRDCVDQSCTMYERRQRGNPSRVALPHPIVPMKSAPDGRKKTRFVD